MDQLAALRAYRSVVEAGSFTRAAERLGTTHTSLSRQIGQLEKHLGVRLLNRNSRGLTPTEAGARYYRDSVDILERMEAARQRAAGDPATPTGVLRVSLPQAIGVLGLSRWLPAFRQRHPGLDLDLSCDDRLVDLIKGGFDMAIRISAPLADSDLVARELAVSERILVAAPRYVAQHGLPRSLDELSEHSLLGYTGDGPVLALGVNDGREISLRTGERLRVDSIPVLYEAALAGQGIATFTRLTVQPALDDGRLLRVLPHVHAGQRHYFAIYPHARQLTAKVRAFTEFMRAHFTGLQANSPG